MVLPPPENPGGGLLYAHGVVLRVGHSLRHGIAVPPPSGREVDGAANCRPVIGNK